MLNVSHLTRSYGSFIAVDDVSFSINKGEIIGLLGHNGAGKTTMMKIISGYLEANSGDILLNGVSIKTDTKSIQQQLGYLPENLPVYPEMSVAEYLDYVADLKGLTDITKEREIKRAIKATDLSAKLLAPISTLSRGYKQRVGVAQAILGKPKLLILDEERINQFVNNIENMRVIGLATGDFEAAHQLKVFNVNDAPLVYEFSENDNHYYVKRSDVGHWFTMTKDNYDAIADISLEQFVANKEQTIQEEGEVTTD